MVVGDRGDDQLVGPGRVAQALQVVGDLLRGADELGVDAVGDEFAVSVAPDVAASLRGGGELDGASSRAAASVSATTTSADTLT